MADDDDQPPTLPGFEHLRPVAVVKDDASPTVRRTARRRRPRIAQGPGAGADR